MTARHGVSLADLARLFGKIGFISFGGPAGQIALMHEEVVERRQWVDEARNHCHAARLRSSRAGFGAARALTLRR